MLPRQFLALNFIQQQQEEEEAQKRAILRENVRSFMNPDSVTNSDFVKRYRLSKDGFRYLCELIKDHIKTTQRVSLETKVLCALLFYANGDYQRVVGVANAYSQQGISNFVEEVTSALNHPEIIKHVINFPNTPDAREEIKQRFYNRYGFPGVVGCIDGSHFRIFKPPRNEEHLYYCRKHYHSLNVQMVCDDRHRILAINPKFGGATHDSFVWANSQLNLHMQSLHENGESVWLLGDSGYPQRPWLMTPYSEATPGTAAASYNGAHMRARVNIENTFGILKNRWRCLSKDRTLHYRPDKCAQIIKACCVLHNIALDFKVPEPEQHNTEPSYQRHEVVQPENLTLLNLGRLMRDRVASIIHAGN